MTPPRPPPSASRPLSPWQRWRWGTNVSEEDGLWASLFSILTTALSMNVKKHQPYPLLRGPGKVDRSLPFPSPSTKPDLWASISPPALFPGASGWSGADSFLEGFWEGSSGQSPVLVLGWGAGFPLEWWESGLWGMASLGLVKSLRLDWLKVENNFLARGLPKCVPTTPVTLSVKGNLYFYCQRGSERSLGPQCFSFSLWSLCLHKVSFSLHL